VVTVEATYKDDRGVVLATARGWSLRTEREAARNGESMPSFRPPPTPRSRATDPRKSVLRGARGATLLIGMKLRG